jgi:hypothetical protein
MSQTHPYFQDQLQSNRRLTPAEQAALDEHLLTCAECRAYATLHQLMLETLPDSTPARRTSERELRQKINNVSARLERRRGPGRFFRQSLSLAGAGMALALLLLALYFVPRMMPGKSTVAQQATQVASGLPGANPVQSTQGDLPASAAGPTLPGGGKHVGSQAPTQAAALLPAAPTNSASPAAAQSGAVTTLAVADQTAFTGIGTRLVAIDIRRPTAPQLVAQSAELHGKVIKVISFTHQGRLGLAVSAGRYLALFESSSPQELTLINQSKLPGPINALIMDLNRGRLYAGGTLQSDAAQGYISVLDPSPADHLELLATIQLPVPVSSLTIANTTLYAAVRGEQPGVAAVPIDKDQFGAAKIVIHSTLVTSMTATGDVLYLGSKGRFLAYSLENPAQPQFAWQLPLPGGSPLPDNITGFAVLPNAIFVVGQDGDGKAVHLALTPPSPLKTGSVIDSAASLAVTGGQLVLIGERLEIYDSRDPRQLALLGALKLSLP